MIFGSLRGRLFASYLSLMVVIIGVIALTLIIVLSRLPAPTEPTYRELTAFSNGFLSDLLRPQRNDNNNTTLRQRFVETLSTLEENANAAGVRILLIDPQSGTVYSDSSDMVQAGTRLDIRVNPDPPRANAPPPPNNNENPNTTNAVDGYINGTFRDENNTQWLFVGLRGNRRVFDNRQLLVAQPRPTSSLQEAVITFGRQLGLVLLLSIVFGLLSASALAYFISRTIALPLQNVAAAAAAVAEGDYSKRVPERGPTEIYEVAHAFNRMSEQVENTQQAQQDLMANISHDLKTPLTSIQGFAQGIVDGAAKDPKHAASIIYDEARRLNRLVIQLTDMARLRAGRLELKTNPLDFGLIVENIGHKLAVVAQKKQITMTTEIAPALPRVNGDGDRLAQVVTNLISNAIKYTPKGGAVYIDVQAHNRGIALRVSDNGIGIDADDLSRIFERFYQVDKARPPQRGTGLGLAITQEIIEAHQGTIQVESAGEQEGSTFTVWLPSIEGQTIAEDPVVASWIKRARAT